MRASGSIADLRSGCAAACPAIEAFQSSIINVDVRLNIAQTSLGRLADIGRR